MTAFEKALADMADLGRRWIETPRGPVVGVYDSPHYLHDFLDKLDAQREAAK